MFVPTKANADVFDLMAVVMALGTFGITAVGAVIANICKIPIVKALYGNGAGITFKSFAGITVVEIFVMSGSLAISFFAVASLIITSMKALFLLRLLVPAAVLHCAFCILPHTWYLERTTVAPEGSSETSRDFIRAGLMGLLTPFWVSLLTVWAVLSLTG